jgi:hypothetical protein
MYRKPQGVITHAQRIFITLLEARQFTRTLVGWGITKSTVTYIYKIVLGEIPPSYDVVFILREHIGPELWYYDENEEVPNTPKTGTRYYLTQRQPAIRKNILQDETVAIREIRKVIEERKLSTFCAIHQVGYGDVRNSCTKRKKPDGMYGYHQRPPYRMIRALRNVIHPRLWYIYPDEIVIDDT